MIYTVPQWPQIIGVSVGGCVNGGRRFGGKAHAHNSTKDKHYGWVCVLSDKRLGSVDADLIVKPSRLMHHEYAHILTPDHGHDRAFIGALLRLGQKAEAKRYLDRQAECKANSRQ